MSHAIRDHGHLHVARKVDEPLHERRRKQRSYRVAGLTHHEDLRDVVQTSVRHDRLGDVGALDATVACSGA